MGDEITKPIDNTPEKPSSNEPNKFRVNPIFERGISEVFINAKTKQNTEEPILTPLDIYKALHDKQNSKPDLYDPENVATNLLKIK